MNSLTVLYFLGFFGILWIWNHQIILWKMIFYFKSIKDIWIITSCGTISAVPLTCQVIGHGWSLASSLVQSPFSLDMMHKQWERQQPIIKYEPFLISCSNIWKVISDGATKNWTCSASWLVAAIFFKKWDLITLLTARHTTRFDWLPQIPDGMTDGAVNFAFSTVFWDMKHAKFGANQTAFCESNHDAKSKGNFTTLTEGEWKSMCFDQFKN